MANQICYDFPRGNRSVGDLRVFISYFDESVSHDKNLVLVAAVVAKESGIRKIEQVLSFLREFEIPEEQQDQFSEFHTSDLYNSRGVFKEVDHSDAERIIYKQAHFVGVTQLSIFYAFVDAQKHKDSLFGNATPLSVAFRKCLEMVEAALVRKAPDELTIAIFDDPGRADVKKDIQIAFRNLRKPLTAVDGNRGKLEHFHDDLYFGSSAFSAKLQIADLCAFLCRRHEEKKDNTEEMYFQFKELIEGRADALE